MLENYRDVIIENDMDYSAIVKFFNGWLIFYACAVLVFKILIFDVSLFSINLPWWDRAPA